MIFIIPVALLFVFILPDKIKDLLILQVDSLNAFTLFSCHFVHEDFANQLLPNILAYFVAVLPLYQLLSALNEGRLFYKLFAFNILAMPFILSLIWVAACKLWNAHTVSYGFSGIASAFLGALIFAYVLFLNKTQKADMYHATLLSMFFTALLFASTYFTPTPAFIAIIILLIVILIPTTYKTIKSIDPKPKTNSKKK